MYKASYQTIKLGLDQLFFSRLIEDERPEDRAEAVEKFLSLNGWSWDDVLKQMEEE